MKYQREIQSIHQHLTNKKITDGPIKPTRTGYTNIKTNKVRIINMKRERIGPKIKQLRKSRALTQKQLADALGYSDKSMITHIEKGDSDMTYEKILLLLRTYMLDANELFDVSEIDKRLEEFHEEKQKKVINSVTDFYNQYDEDARLKRRYGQVEYLTTNKYIHEYLKPDNKVIEIGAGTGAYSIPLAKEGYDVTAVELVEHNLDILRAKITEDMNIKAYQGNALDLSMFEDESFDVTLLLGPMYHLFSKEDKIKALSEAKRITKCGGYIFVAYCMNDATIIQYAFGCNKLHELMNFKMITDDWHCVSEEKDIFDLVRIEDIDEYNKESVLTRIKIIATDGAAHYLKDYLEQMDLETFKQWVNYHLSTCERMDLIGASNHTLDILLK